MRRKSPTLGLGAGTGGAWITRKNTSRHGPGMHHFRPFTARFQLRKREMGKFAEKTRVPVFQSIGEIQRTVEKYGAFAFQFVVEDKRAGIAFKIAEPKRMIKLAVELPDDDQGIRQRWRALLLVVKSKLECVESGIETFDEAWMPHIVVERTGQTLGQLLLGDMDKKLESGEMPKLLLE